MVQRGKCRYNARSIGRTKCLHVLVARVKKKNYNRTKKKMQLKYPHVDTVDSIERSAARFTF